MAYIDVPVSKLTLSTRYQARKQPSQQPIPELANSIHAQGLLQNLVVVKGKGGMYEVVAGGRRMQACQLLVKDGRWSADKTVTVLQVKPGVALEASITENTQRENMHPADEFEAFNNLIASGKSVEYVANRFAVTPVYVQRRMLLANVAPDLIDAYRDGEMTLEMLMAFTVSDDHEKQMQVWLSLPDWNRNARIIKEMLKKEAVTAQNKVARFVGLEVYKEAGGAVTCDLFSDDPSGIYIDQPELLQQLAFEKLDKLAESYRQAGWGWVETRLSFDYEDMRQFGRVYPKAGPLTDEQQKQIENLSKQYDAAADRLAQFEAEHEGDESEETSEQWNSLSEAMGKIEEEIDAIQESAPAVWPEGTQAVAGVVLSINYSGSVDAQEGLIKREDREEAKEVAEAAGETDSCVSLPAHNRRPTHSEKLVRQLSANKTAVVQASLASSPHVALAVFVSQLAVKHFSHGYDAYLKDLGLGVTTNPESLPDAASDFQQSRAGQRLTEINQEWLDQLPKDGDKLGNVLEWALEQDIDTLVKLQAYLIAITMKGIQSTEPTEPTKLDKVAALLDLNMAEWWEPTAETYLSHVSKDRIIAVVSDAAGAEAAAPLQKMKKAEAARAAEQLLSGTGWLPEIMKIKEKNHA